MLTRSLFAAALALVQPLSAAAATNTTSVNTTTCNGNTYTYRSLAGYGFVPGNARDKYGDTLGGLGSSIAIERGSWRRSPNGSYTGILWALPDRGWNTNGTLNYNPRVHKLALSFTPAASSASPNLRLDYLDTVLFSAPDGEPVTGLDGDAKGVIKFDGFPELPVATDEYGPYIYRFSKEGRMVGAIRPPDAFIPMRNGSESFSAASPPLYDPDRATTPEDPTSGRANNQGFEGLTLSPDGRTLSALVQSALMQEGGAKSSTRRHARLVQYDISDPSRPARTAAHVVALPTYANAAGKTRVAAQSELLALGPSHFLVLARDSGAGRAAAATDSLYRHVDAFDVANATNLVDGTGAATLDGALAPGVVPAEYCAWLDFNVNAQLERFGLHNGGVDDAGLLNEKWESLAVVPVLGDGGEAVEGEWFIVSLSDNDFITQEGFMDGGRFAYADETGASLDNQALVFRVGLEAGLGVSWR
ncbi:putative outer membrane autotransporter protein [Neofusicoccum parvum UCRNP2]|uniref:Putative outer membrane autotransporter protein n=1 Tax=Botryosphaeria parva (strain UCR-NP2) TaxID=1287680 RepID=R1ERX5_BOTPV|nr:putative outer membrane autotransporter protein [Neofusicoccum parvum UCRNP2]